MEASNRKSGGRLVELLGLLGLSKALLGAADPAAAAAALLETVVAMYGFPRAVLVSARGDRLIVMASHGLANGAAPGPEVSAGVGQTVMESGTRLLSRVDEANEPWLAQLFPGGVDVLVVAAAPADEWNGALLVQLPMLRQRHWRSLMMEPLEWAVSATASALRGLFRVEQAERMAATDGVTNIANRITFTAALERELARSSCSGQPMSLVMFDLDQFKQVNDQHGHQAGDEALRDVAKALAVACRDHDTAARYGGEEFVVLLPTADPNAASRSPSDCAPQLPRRLGFSRWSQLVADDLGMDLRESCWTSS